MTKSNSEIAYRIGLIGSGALGLLIKGSIDAGALASASVTSVLSRSGGSLDHLIENSDIVVEAAGQAALRAHGPAIIAAGKPLVALSSGVLADDKIAGLLMGGPGRFIPSAGAIGGFDLIDTLRISGTLTNVALHTVKVPSSLLQPWMSESQKIALEESRTFINVFTGSARDATRLFPANANVAATLGVRSIGLDRTRVTIDADPSTRSTQHTLVIDSKLGTYQLTFANAPSLANPKSSDLAAFSALHDLGRLIGQTVALTTTGGSQQ